MCCCSSGVFSRYFSRSRFVLISAVVINWSFFSLFFFCVFVFMLSHLVHSSKETLKISAKMNIMFNKVEKVYLVLLLTFAFVLHNTQWIRNIRQTFKIVEIACSHLWHYVHFLASIHLSGISLIAWTICAMMKKKKTLLFTSIFYHFHGYLCLYCFMMYFCIFIYKYLRN